MKLKTKILLALSTISILFFGFYIVGYFLIYFISNKYFIEGKVTKSIHMDYHLSKQSQKDYIFIGSSRTLNHISTEVFKKSEIEIYNYGVAGHPFGAYAYMVIQAIELKPKHIVISLPIANIEQKIGIGIRFPTYQDYKFVEKYSKNKISFKSINELIAEQVRIKDIYKQLLQKFQRTNKEITDRLNIFGYKQSDIDCRITDFRGDIKRTVFLCNNGDGFILSNFNHKNIKYSEKNIIMPKLREDNLLLALIEEIKANDITPIIVFEPTSFNQKLNYNIELLQSKMDCLILDNSNFNITNDSVWSDKGHFNYKGKQEYSKHLVKQLSKIK